MRRPAIWAGVALLLLGSLWLALRFRGSPADKTPSAAGSARSTQLPSSASSAAPQVSVAAPTAAPSAPRRASNTRRDKQLRDDMRKRIYAAFGQPLPEDRPAQAAAPTRRPGEPGLSKEYLQERIREDFIPLARECYEAALEQNPSLAGKVVMSFEIVGDESVGGVVESAELGEGSTLDDPEFNTCMRESMLSMAFEPPKGGGSVTVNYPILFDPGDEDAGPAGKRGDAGEDAAPR